MLAPSSLMASPCNYNCFIFSFFFCSIVASQCSKKGPISHHCSKTCPGCRQDSARLRFRELTWAYSAGWRIFRLHIFGCMWAYGCIWAYSAGSWIYCIHIFGYMWAYMVVYGHIRLVGCYMIYIYLNILEFTIFFGIFGMLVEVGT